ncbi:MAG: Mov34/MPN/PAD-1 family protein [Chloroflexota bacterium]
MSVKRRFGNGKHGNKKAMTANQEQAGHNKDEKVVMDEWKSRKRPIKRRFEGPQNVQVALRIAFDKAAYADVVVHAKESLDKEICGVLVGEICEDDEGLFVCAKAAIRGKAAHQNRAHVTFTQQTWNTIHKEKDEKYSGLWIVGWYHSHPGFGVEISDMDRFIQENFFSSETQFGFVTDPLNGEVAIVVNTAEGVCNVDRFWVDAREHKCYVPGMQACQSQEGGSPNPGATFDALERVNTRLSQVVQALDDLRNSYYRFLTTLGLIICMGLVLTIGYHIYNSLKARLEPPELRSYVPVPVQIGDKSVLLGVGVMQWNVPPELNAAYLEVEQMKLEAAEKEAKQEATELENDAENTQKTSEKSDESEE